MEEQGMWRASLKASPPPRRPGGSPPTDIVASARRRSISVTFVEKDGKETTVKAPLGKSLLEVAHDNEVELEGACV